MPKDTDFNSVGQNGILALFHTGKSNASNDSLLPVVVVREATFRLLTGTQLGSFKGRGLDQAHLQRILDLVPRSAYLNITTVGKIYENTGGPTQYGQVAASLNNSVKSRSIWATEDTLTMSANPFEKDGGSLKDQLAKHEALVDRQTGIFSYDAKIPVNNYGNERAKLLGLKIRANSKYSEVLVFGNITLQDIDYFLFCDSGDPPLRLIQLGKPIYRGVRKEPPVGRDVFLKGDRIAN